jgi:hypothetical protein
MSELTSAQVDKLMKILDRVQNARRELDALIGDNYLSPRVSIVGVHFNSLAAAVEKLRWAEKESRELRSQLEDSNRAGTVESAEA